MNRHYRNGRKIDPAQGSMLADGTPNEGDRIEIGPPHLALNEWKEAGLTLPNLPEMRA